MALMLDAEHKIKVFVFPIKVNLSLYQTKKYKYLLTQEFQAYTNLEKIGIELSEQFMQKFAREMYLDYLQLENGDMLCCTNLDFVNFTPKQEDLFIQALNRIPDGHLLLSLLGKLTAYFALVKIKQNLSVLINNPKKLEHLTNQGVTISLSLNDIESRLAVYEKAWSRWKDLHFVANKIPIGKFIELVKVIMEKIHPLRFRLT